jgi:hypothetical protein
MVIKQVIIMAFIQERLEQGTKWGKRQIGAAVLTALAIPSAAVGVHEVFKAKDHLSTSATAYEQAREIDTRRMVLGNDPSMTELRQEIGFNHTANTATKDAEISGTAGVLLLLTSGVLAAAAVRRQQQVQ